MPLPLPTYPVMALLCFAFQDIIIVHYKTHSRQSEMHPIELANQAVQKIDISRFPRGQYWIEIKTKSNLERYPFIKL